MPRGLPAAVHQLPFPLAMRDSALRGLGFIGVEGFRGLGFRGLGVWGLGI